MFHSRMNPRNSFRFTGPFDILFALNPVTVCLNLPRNMKIHNAFHVSQVKLGHRPIVPTFQTPTPCLGHQWCTGLFHNTDYTCQAQRIGLPISGGLERAQSRRAFFGALVFHSNRNMLREFYRGHPNKFDRSP